MKLGYLSLAILGSLALPGCNMAQNDASTPQVQAQPAVVHHAPQPALTTQPQPMTVKHAPGMVPLVTQANVHGNQPMHHQTAQTMAPRHITITETVTGNPLLTGMIMLNGKPMTLANAITYLAHIQDQRHQLLAKNQRFVNAINEVYVGNTKLNPQQTQALLRYMRDNQHPMSYQGVDHLPLKPDTHVALHLNHIEVNGQALTGSAAMAFVNGLIAQEQLNTSTTTAVHSQPMTAIQPAMHHPMMTTQPQSMHHVQMGVPMHQATPPTPASAEPTTSVVQQPQPQSMGSK